MARPQSDATALVESGAVFLRGDAQSKEDVTGILTRISGEFDIASTLAGKAEDGRRADDVELSSSPSARPAGARPTSPSAAATARTTASPSR